MQKHILTAVAAMLCLAGGAQAADTLRVDLGKAVEIALSENPTIKIADKEIERVDYSKKAAWGSLLPSLTWSAQYSKYVIPAKMSMMGSVMDSPTDFNLAASVSLQLPLVVPALWQAIKMSALDMQLASEKARASKVTMRNEVMKAFFNMLLAQDSYGALQEGYKIANENFLLAQNLYKAGMGSEYDYVSAEVQMNNLLPNLLQVENGIHQANLYLKVLMGVADTVPLVVDGSLAQLERDVVHRDSIKTALANNTDLVQLNLQLQQLEKSLSIQRMQRLPTLVGIGQYGYTGTGTNETSINLGAIPIQVAAKSDWFSSGLILGLQLNVPIFAGFTNVHKEKQIKIQVKELEMQRDYLERSLNVQVSAAIDNMEKAVKQMSTNKKAVGLAERAYKIATTRYNTGMGTMLELNSSALSLTQAKLTYHQAISDYLNARTDYEKLVGQ